MKFSLKFLLLVLICLVAVGTTSFYIQQTVIAQEGGTNVIRIAEGSTLRVYNDGSMETFDGGVEYLASNELVKEEESLLDSSTPVEEIPITITVSDGIETEPKAEEEEYITITYVTQGTVTVNSDGMVTTSDDGLVEFIRMPRSEYESLLETAPTEVETIEVEIIPTDTTHARSSCTNYQAIAYFYRGTNLKRTVDYCVNSGVSSGVVIRYRLKNIGSTDSAILSRVWLGSSQPWWESSGGPWVIVPGATLDIGIWSGVNYGIPINDDWLYETDTQSCIEC